MPSKGGDLVDRIFMLVRRNPLGAALVAVFVLVTGLGTFLGAWRQIRLQRGTLELTDMTVINDPEDVAAFRRTWLGDTAAGAALPSDDRPPTWDSRRTWAESATLVTRGTSLVFSPPLPPESLQAWRERDEAAWRNWRDWPGERGTGLLPVIDLKFRNTASSAAFLTRIEFVATRRSVRSPPNAFCAATPPSWEYNVLLDPAKDSQHVALDISQAVAPNSVDRFVIVVGPGGSDGELDVELTVHYNRDQLLRLGRVRVEIGTPLCRPMHSLDSLRRLAR